MSVDSRSAVRRILACAACGRASVDDPLCGRCLDRRTPRWVALHRHVQEDPAFALAVYRKINSARGRELFTRVYGRPPLRDGSDV